MKILYSPQLNEDNILTYEFNGEKIIATLNGEVDEFDFSAMTNDGKAEDIESDLPINPVVEAERRDGVLHVTLLNFISMNATEEENFPQWIEV